MERITNEAWGNLDPWECCGQDNYCKRGCHEEGGCNNGCIVPRLYRRLAMYEDTGLTPKEIHELTHDSYGPLHKKLGQWIDAERDGRLVILPCKVGDAVYLITDANKRYKPFIAKGYIESFRFHGGRKGQLKKKMYIPSRAEKDDDVIWCGGTFNQEAFGKTIFLTKEEAEAELKGGTQ